MDTVQAITVIGIFTLCFLPDCFVSLQSSTDPHLSLSGITSFIFHLLVLPSWGKHAWVQLECKWINTSELIQTQTHRTPTVIWSCQVSHTRTSLYIHAAYEDMLLYKTTYSHMGSQTHPTHQVLSGDTCASACSHCCPLGCAVLHTVLTACPPSETKHLWTNILQEWYTADAKDIPRCTQWCLLCQMLASLVSFDCKVWIVPTFLYS